MNDEEYAMQVYDWVVKTKKYMRSIAQIEELRSVLPNLPSKHQKMANQVIDKFNATRDVNYLLSTIEDGTSQEDGWRVICRSGNYDDFKKSLKEMGFEENDIFEIDNYLLSKQLRLPISVTVPEMPQSVVNRLLDPLEEPSIDSTPTSDQPFGESFTRVSDKQGGANDAGVHGGVYVDTQGKKYLFKQDTKKVSRRKRTSDPQSKYQVRVGKVIAEGVAGDMLASLYAKQGVNAEHYAKTSLVRVAGSDDESGNDTYLKSEFIDNYRDDYWRYAFRKDYEKKFMAILKEPDKSKAKQEFIEEYYQAVKSLDGQAQVPFKNIDLGTESGKTAVAKFMAIREVDKIKNPRSLMIRRDVKKIVSAQIREDKKLKQFAQIMAPRLLIGDFGLHSANIGINNAGDIVALDYGAAFCDLRPQVNPYRHVHTGTSLYKNHFLDEYDDDINKSPEMAFEFIRLGELDEHQLNNWVNDSIKNLADMNEEALKKFCQRLGIKPIVYAELGNTDDLKNVIKKRLTERLEQRKQSLENQGFMLLVEHCIKHGKDFDFSKYDQLLNDYANDRFTTENERGELKANFNNRLENFINSKSFAKMKFVLPQEDDRKALLDMLKRKVAPELEQRRIKQSPSSAEADYPSGQAHGDDEGTPLLVKSPIKPQKSPLDENAKSRREKIKKRVRGIAAAVTGTILIGVGIAVGVTGVGLPLATVLVGGGAALLTAGVISTPGRKAQAKKERAEKIREDVEKMKMGLEHQDRMDSSKVQNINDYKQAITDANDQCKALIDDESTNELIRLHAALHLYSVADYMSPAAENQAIAKITVLVEALPEHARFNDIRSNLAEAFSWKQQNLRLMSDMGPVPSQLQESNQLGQEQRKQLEKCSKGLGRLDENNNQKLVGDIVSYSIDRYLHFGEFRGGRDEYNVIISIMSRMSYLDKSSLTPEQALTVTELDNCLKERINELSIYDGKRPEEINAAIERQKLQFIVAPPVAEAGERPSSTMEAPSGLGEAREDRPDSEPQRQGPSNRSFK